VLARLGPPDLASLAGVGRGCAAAVAATALMQWAKLVKSAPRAPGDLGYLLGPLCLMQACSYAAGGGNKEVLEWLHNTGCPWNTTTCSHAALHGQLHVLQWAREHGCPWDLATPAFAADGGHLPVLQWAREHHCPWTSSTCSYAARVGHLEVLQWVWENDATGEAWDEGIVRRHAGGLRKQEVLTWLDQIRWP